jgi:myo-inositol-1(or 4)-monophosphatase
MMDATRGLDDSRLALAVALAREGGRQALAVLGQMAFIWKGPGDRTTATETAIQSRIAGQIAEAFPDDGMIAEQQGGTRAPDQEFVWVIDPLDGTDNLALGIPCFAVSIGILRSGFAYAGVVHDPNTQFTCWARRGRGAFAGAQRLALTAQPLGAASNVAVRVPLDARLKPLVGDWLEQHELRGFGSVALHLAYAAIGAFDVVLDHKATLWDLAAGATLVLEAGGAISGQLGGPLFPADPALYRGGPVAFVAGNAMAHAETVARCRALLGSGDGRA